MTISILVAAFLTTFYVVCAFIFGTDILIPLVCGVGLGLCLAVALFVGAIDD